MTKLLLLLPLAAYVAGSTAPILSLLGLEPTATYASENQGDDNTHGDDNDDEQ